MGNSYGWLRAVGETEASHIFDKLDRDRNGYVTLKELMTAPGPGVMMPHSLPALYFFDKDASGRLSRAEFMALLRFCDEEKRKVETDLSHNRQFRNVIRKASAAGVKDSSAKGRLSFRAISSYSNVRSIFRKDNHPTHPSRHSHSDEDEELTLSSSDKYLSSSARSSLEHPPLRDSKKHRKHRKAIPPNEETSTVGDEESLSDTEDTPAADPADANRTGGVRMYSSQREFEDNGAAEPEDSMAPLEAESRTAVDAAVLERIMHENIQKLGELLQNGTLREEFMEWLWKLTDFNRQGVVTLEELRIFLRALEEDGIFLEELAFYKEGDIPLEESIINEFDTTHTGLLTRDEFLVLGDLVTREYEHWTNRHLERIGDYEFGRIIGRGSSGIVRLALHVPTREKVAIKIIKKGNCSALSRLDREIESLAQATHENIVRLLEVMDSEQNVFIVMELCGGGSLVDIVMLYNDERIPESHARFYCRQLFESVAFLHSKGICHRDIRMDNLMLTNTGVLKITDFGHSGAYQPGWDLFSTTLVGSVYNLSPEQVDGKAYSGEKIDVWSAGIVLYSLLVGHPPFFDADTTTFLNSILTGTFEIPDFVSKEAAELIRCMIRVAPSDRLPFEQLKLHPWFYSGQESRPVMDTVVIPVDPFFKKRPDLAEMIMAGTMYENNLHFHLADTTNPRSFPEVLRGQAWALKCLSLDLNIRFTVSLFTSEPHNPKDQKNKKVIRHAFSYPRFMNNIEPDMSATLVINSESDQVPIDESGHKSDDNYEKESERPLSESDFRTDVDSRETEDIEETVSPADDIGIDSPAKSYGSQSPGKRRRSTMLKSKSTPILDDSETSLLFGGSISDGEMGSGDVHRRAVSYDITGSNGSPKRRGRSSSGRGSHSFKHCRSKSLDFTDDDWQLRFSRSVTVDAFPYHMVLPQRTMPEQARDISFDKPDETLEANTPASSMGELPGAGDIIRRTEEHLPDGTSAAAIVLRISKLHDNNNNNSSDANSSNTGTAAGGAFGTRSISGQQPSTSSAVAAEFMPYIEVRLRDGESGLFLRVCRKLKTICGTKLANAAERQKRRVSSRRSVTMLRRSAAQKNEAAELYNDNDNEYNDSDSYNNSGRNSSEN